MKYVDIDLAGLTSEGFEKTEGISDYIINNYERQEIYRQFIRKYYTPTKNINRNYNSGHIRNKLRLLIKAEADIDTNINIGEMIYCMYLEGFRVDTSQLKGHFNISSSDYNIITNAPIIIKSFRKIDDSYEFQDMINLYPNYQKYKYHLKYIITSYLTLDKSEEKFVIPFLAKQIGFTEQKMKSYINTPYNHFEYLEDNQLEILAEVLNVSPIQLINTYNIQSI